MRTLFIFALASMSLLAIAFGSDCNIDGHSLKIDETYAPPKECIQYTCFAAGNYGAKGCPAMAAADTCKYIPEDLSKPYPECCPNYIC